MQNDNRRSENSEQKSFCEKDTLATSNDGFNWTKICSTQVRLFQSTLYQ